MSFIKFRLTAIDTVQLDVASYPSTVPSAPFVPRVSPLLPEKTTINKVPEIRIWGATEAGQRCCVHVHGALPYVYIEYTGSLDPEAVQTYIRQLARGLNRAMFLSFRSRGRADYDPAKDQYVGFIALCKGVPFYGFHVGYRYFLKIHALQPRFSRRLFDILKSGSVMPIPGKKSAASKGEAVSPGFQVYEAHVPYILQFMLDFNLYGCGWIELSKCKFRGELPCTSRASLTLYLPTSSYRH